MSSGTNARRRGAKRQRLVEQMDLAGREVSTSTVVYHSALAALRGLSAIETKTLDILLRRGPLTHAELVTATARAPASVSGLIDRLVAKGYAVRRPHPTDGRRVLVVAETEYLEADLAPLFEDWHRKLNALYDDYTDDQLAVISDFLRRAAALQLTAAESLAASG